MEDNVVSCHSPVHSQFEQRTPCQWHSLLPVICNLPELVAECGIQSLALLVISLTWSLSSCAICAVISQMLCCWRTRALSKACSAEVSSTTRKKWREEKPRKPCRIQACSPRHKNLSVQRSRFAHQSVGLVRDRTGTTKEDRCKHCQTACMAAN